MSDRIAAIETLEAVLDRFPQLRVCQLIANATAQNDVYNVTDEQLLYSLMAYLERHGKGAKGRR
jgi:hypothetical protein